jgi:cell wall-associated NlpC family hydrolase
MSRLAAFIFVTAAAFTAGCASTGATPRPFPTPAAPAPRATPNAPTPNSQPTPKGQLPTPNGGKGGYEVAGTALSLRGAPYRNGGSDPAGFDCSGFVQYVYGQHGVSVPRKVSDMYRAGKDVQPAQLQPGDLVFFTTVSPGASHVGIAIGGDEFVHAPSGVGTVRVERMSASYWATRFVGARRVL